MSKLNKLLFIDHTLYLFIYFTTDHSFFLAQQNLEVGVKPLTFWSRIYAKCHRAMLTLTNRPHSSISSLEVVNIVYISNATKKSPKKGTMKIYITLFY